MNPTLLALILGLAGVILFAAGKKKRLLKFLSIPVCIFAIFTALLHINDKPDADRINHLESAYFEAQAEVLTEEIARKGGSKCLIVHAPFANSKTGFEACLLAAMTARKFTVSFTIPSSWTKAKTETFEPYFEGSALPPILKLKGFDAIVFTAGLPPPTELAEVPHFAHDADKPLFKTDLYVFNGDDPGLLPYVRSGALTGLICWRPKAEVPKEPLDTLSNRQIFDSRYLLVLHGKLHEIAAKEKNFYPKIMSEGITKD